MGKISTIIEIGSGKVVSIVGELGQYDEMHILGSSSVEYPGIKNGRLVDKHTFPTAIIRAITAAEKQAGRHCRQIHVGVPAEFVEIVCVQAAVTFDTAMTITQEDVDKLYAKARGKLNIPAECIILHRCPVLFTLDGVRRTMEPIGRRAKKLGVLLSYVLAEKWFVGGVKNILEKYGYTTNTVVSASYAEAIGFIPQEKRDHGACMIDFGSRSTCVMIARGDGLLYHTVLPFGGANITGDLQKVFSVSEQIAEDLKKRAIFGLCLVASDSYEVCDNASGRFMRFPASRVQEIIESRISEMLEVIQAKLDNSGCVLQSYAPYYITGGTAEMRGLREFLQKQTGHTTVIVQPQSTCFTSSGYASALAVMDMGLGAETDDEVSFFDMIKNFFKGN